MAELIGERDEIALGVDDALLHPGGGLFEEAPQKVGFAGTGIALDQETGGQQFLKVHVGSAGTPALAHVDCNLHLNSSTRVE
jgi:hypothetical protein